MSETTAERTRTVKVFDWDEVATEVVRELLQSTKRVVLEDHDVRNLGDWDESELRSAVAKIYGRLPPRTLDPVFAQVLAQSWLPRREDRDARDETIASLALLVRGRQRLPYRLDALPAGRSARLDLIRGALGQRTVRKALRREFVLAHRRAETVKVLPTEKRVVGPVALSGEHKEGPHPYDHQREAWEALDRHFAASTSGAMVVLPTGAGKTFTAVSWLLRRMEADPELRVLWIAAQQSLIDQAVLEAQQIATLMPPGFERVARAIHSQASERGTFAAADHHFVAVTIQTLSRIHGNSLNAWFKRPCFVVVDEAHHAGADDQTLFLRRARDRYPGLQGVIGLSATPNPAGAEARRRVRELFPRRVIEVSLDELIERRILARPEFSTVRTHYEPVLDERQLDAAAGRADLAPEILLELGDDRARNTLVVEHWARERDRWGKTIIFCADIAMADAIAALLADGGHDARALHSGRLSASRAEVLDWFKRADGPCALVAVSMLNEGVDLPSANTAFLARPTKDRRLLKQMVGRVLRGVAAGGTAEALVVDFRDDWPSLVAILGPEEVVEDPDGVTWPHGARGRLDQLPAGFFRAALRLLEPHVEPPPVTTVPRPTPPEPPLPTTRANDLVITAGYRLGDDQVPYVPVFRHHAAAFRAFEARAREHRRMPPLDSFFVDTPEPRPLAEHLVALRTALQAGDTERIDLDVAVGPALAAQKIRDDGLEGVERAAAVEEAFRALYPDGSDDALAEFTASVDDLFVADWRGDFVPRPAGPAAGTLTLRRRDDARLARLLAEVATEGRELLSEELRGRLGDPPPVRWTRRAVETWFGLHTYTPVLKKGEEPRAVQDIRINRLLCADEIEDDLVRFLLWHELLHHVLLSQHHDDQFFELERKWPGATGFDVQLGTFHERWITDPERYRLPD